MKILGTKKIKPVHRDNPPEPVVVKDEPAPEKLELITGARLIRMPRGDQRYPAALYASTKAPAKGSKINLKMDNGTIYSGTVHDSTEADGEVLVEFRDGLTPS